MLNGCKVVSERKCVTAPDVPPAQRLKILVVAARALDRLLLKTQLERPGYEVVICNDGASALQVWKGAALAFDLTITDCKMPLMSGYELTCRMRDWERGLAQRNHPIFGLTGSVQAHSVEQSMSAGMTFCLCKPIRFAVLMPMIDALAQERERRLLAAASTSGGELQKIRLLCPEAYGPLVDKMVKSHREDAVKLAKWVQSNDFEGLARLAHRLLGGALLADERALMQACETLQTLALQGAGQACQAQIAVVLSGLQVLEERLLQDR